MTPRSVQDELSHLLRKVKELITENETLQDQQKTGLMKVMFDGTDEEKLGDYQVGCTLTVRHPKKLLLYTKMYICVTYRRVCHCLLLLPTTPLLTFRISVLPREQYLVYHCTKNSLPESQKIYKTRRRTFNSLRIEDKRIGSSVNTKQNRPT